MSTDPTNQTTACLPAELWREIDRLRAALLRAIRYGEGCSNDKCWDGGKRDHSCKCVRLFRKTVSE